MLLSLHGADPLPALLASAGCRPCWAAARSARSTRSWPLRWVDVDNAGGARAAVDHLIASGRRRIAHVAGPQDMAVGIGRLAGYRAALAGEPVADRTRRVRRLQRGAAAPRPRADLLARVPDLDAIFARQRPDGPGRAPRAAAGRARGCRRTSRWSASRTPPSRYRSIRRSRPSTSRWRRWDGRWPARCAP